MGVELNISSMKNMWLKYSWIPILIFIFLFSFWVRAAGIVPDRILSYDPTYEYRYTKYIVDYGVIPFWDELSYYVGRIVNPQTQATLFLLLAAIVYSITKYFGMSLMTSSTYYVAFLGALIPVAVFLFIREVSNNWGGIFGAALVGTAPQILIRTFGASYDTDQIVVFFMILTIWLGVRAIKYKTPSSIFLAVTGFLLYALTWGMFIYSLIMVFAILGFYIFIMTLFNKAMLKNIFINFRKELIVAVCLFILLVVVAYLNNTNVIANIFAIFGFAVAAEQLIVNISIAELQIIDMGSIATWITSIGRIAVGYPELDYMILLALFSFIFFGLWYTYKQKKFFETSIISVIFILSIFTLYRGIRFTEFTSLLLLSLVGIGFGYMQQYLRTNKIFYSFCIAIAIIIVLTSLTISAEMGPTLGPDMNENWNSAWNFLKTKTPEKSIVGTWWDPGHMIAGLGERRNFADGAHCPPTMCKYSINDRITDTGRIFATINETESVNLIRKYKGTSPEVYWIASSDLVGKFQWIQYFGMGCDARKEQRCPLYLQINARKIDRLPNGNQYIDYGDIKAVMANNSIIPIFVSKRNGMLFGEMIVYDDGKPKAYKINTETINITDLGRQFNARFSNETLPYTIAFSKQFNYITLIPITLRETVFTKMFFFNGEGLDNFELVFSNDDVKIFKVKL